MMTKILLLTLLLPALSVKPDAPADMTGAWTFEWKPDFS